MGSKSIVRVAHRGASAHYPENTLLACQQAIWQGVDALEIDVQLTSDAELVVIHDAHLDRTTNGHGLVNEHTLAEIRKLDAGQGQSVPLLNEIIELARASHTRLCVEIKGTSEAEQLRIGEAIIQVLEVSDFLSQVIITSFSPKALLHVKTLNLETATMLDPSPQDGTLTPREICAQTLRSGANCLSYDFRFLTPEIIKECHLSGLAIWPWDPDNADDLYRLIQLEVDGLMTNAPATLNKVLHEAIF